MKVAIITRDYPPAIGGIATHVEGLVDALRRMGVEADLYVGSHDVRTLLLPFDIPLTKYDVVHVQSLPYGAFVFGVPLVVTVHSPVLEEFAHYRNSLKVVSLPAIAMEKATLSRASAVLAVSNQSRADLFNRYRVQPTKVEVIGNGVDYRRFSGPRDAANRSSAKKVLVVSRLEPRKNVKEAIEAVAELPKGACDLEIVGDGSERAALVDLAKGLGLGDAAHFLGRVGEALLPEIYGGSAIFLTTSSSEGFGLSLLEAMSCLVKGTIVSTSIGPMPIEDIREGALVLTHAGRFRPVLRKFGGRRGGQMYVIESEYGRLCATPTHKFLTRNGWKSADSLYNCWKLGEGGCGVHRWLSGWREPYVHRNRQAEQGRQASRCRSWSSTGSSGCPELQAPASSVLATGETWRTCLSGPTSSRVKMDHWRQTGRRSRAGDLAALFNMQEGCCNSSLGGLQQETLFRNEHPRGMDLVHRQGHTSPYDKFGIQPSPPPKDSQQVEWVEIRNIEAIRYSGEIFDLSVAEDNSYIANRTIVHNSGCACIASDLPTHRALIEHGTSGMIYTSRAELVSCLKELLFSPDKVERLGVAARQVAIVYSWEKVAERVIKAYERADQGSKR